MKKTDNFSFLSLDLVGVDAAITIEDEIFDQDLENKSSTRYQTLEQQVKQEVRLKTCLLRRDQYVTSLHKTSVK